MNNNLKVITSSLLTKFNQDINHGFFSRIGGLSSGNFSSLNFNDRLEEEKENVAGNYEIIANYLNIKRNNILSLKQVHGNKVILIDKSNYDNRPLAEPFYREKFLQNGEGENRKILDISENQRQKLPIENRSCNRSNDFSSTEADAFVSKEVGVCLAIKTADCLPIIFYDNKNKIIGICHAGWRGLRAGVIENTLGQMVLVGADPSTIYASIMPSIDVKNYEVDKLFFDNFISDMPDNRKYFYDIAKPDHYLFNLKIYAKDKLIKNGIAENQIEIINIDSYINPDICFSFRRATHKNEKVSGNNLSFIYLK